MRIFISAGEASGDAYGAALVRELKRLDSTLEFEGVGGRRMAAEGVNLHVDSSTWGAIGIIQALKIYPRAVAGGERMKAKLRKGKPGLFIPIDFGYANIRWAKAAKKAGWKVLYFVPPGSWRRDRQGKDLPMLTDAVVTPFPWSAAILSEMGANAHFFGHPIKQLIGKGGPPGGAETVAILPGSREHEVEEILPVIAESIRDLRAPAEFGVAPSLDATVLERRWKEFCPQRTDTFTVGDTYGVLARARAGIVCSGTATLEAALLRCPMVVVYRLPASALLEAKIVRFKRPKFIALPNILLDRRVVPELVQDEAQPTAIHDHLGRLLEETGERQSQLDAFQEIDTFLGPDDAITRTAELALKIAGR